MVILFRDISKFLLLFLVVLITFTGSLHLSLRYDSAIALDKNDTMLRGCGANSNQRNLTDGRREYYEVLFTGVRSFLEIRSVLMYYGDNARFG